MSGLDGDELPAASSDASDDRDAYRDRPSRLPVDATVTLRTQGGGVDAHACDVSEHGLKVETDAPLAAGPIDVKMVGFPIFTGQVRWHGGRQVGIEFANPIPSEFLKTWVKAHGFRRS